MKSLQVHIVLVLACLAFHWNSRAADTTPPAVQSLSPNSGSTVSSLTQVTITFTEPITGLEVEDLLISGNTASTRTGNSNVWTFTFTQPLPGVVAFTWDASQAIYDLAGNRFDDQAIANRWSYTLTDTIAPTAAVTTPRPGAVV